jgi:DNA primase
LWADFAGGGGGDALDLVRAVLGLDMLDALIWARRWLGIDLGEATVRTRPASTSTTDPAPDPERWRGPWQTARPIAGTLAEVYLNARGLRFDDPAGDVLRFASLRARKNPEDQLEYHPALLALLRDFRTGEACGIINIYLRQDGSDRLRDRKGKTNTGRSGGAAVMLSDFADVTMGLTICEGPETGIALLVRGLAPVWALGGAGNLGLFPLLGGIEALTIAADPGIPGQQNAAKVASRWRAAAREASIITPPAGDWAKPERGSA